MPGFNEVQIAALEAPLSRAHVKTRAQAGRNLSYLEGWVAIAEANRIFGFDMWHRETVEMRQLGDPREVDGKWRVGYMAKVRIEVFAEDRCIIREGSGYGSGIDRDVGSAHESAIKEAETDAMKRALMTFGNPFGLALYDKDQANVEAVASPSRAPASTAPVTPLSTAKSVPAPSANVSDEVKARAARTWADKAIVTLKGCKRIAEIDEWLAFEERGKTNTERVADVRTWDTGKHLALTAAIRDRYALLEPVNNG